MRLAVLLPSGVGRRSARSTRYQRRTSGVIGGPEEDAQHLTYEALESCLDALLQRTEMPAAHAAVVAEALALTDLRGVQSHGAAQMTGYVKRLLTGDIDPTGEPRVIHRR